MTSQIRIEDLETLIAEFERSDCAELHARVSGIELFFSKNADSIGLASSAAPPAQAPVAAGGRSPSPAPLRAPPPKAKAPARNEIPDGCVVVEAPYQGIFYRSPKPGSPPFVEIGAKVTLTDDLCLVEVMKLFTAVRASAAGVVQAILAEDGQMVAAGQPLFAIEAAA